jgi:hypothetical protein
MPDNAVICIYNLLDWKFVDREYAFNSTPYCHLLLSAVTTTTSNTMIANFSKLQAAFAALALVAFVGRTSAATVKYAGTFADYFGDAYEGGNDVLNDTEREWLNSGKILLTLCRDTP